MKRIGISHRVDFIESYGERRDSIDQSWYTLLLDMGMLPIPLPNLPVSNVNYLLSSLKLDGIILTGGNSISELDDSAKDIAPERDLFEIALINICITNNLPLLGVCRGMQMINHYFKGSFEKVNDHVGTVHNLHNISKLFDFPESVNSYHNWAIPKSMLGKGLLPLAEDVNGNIEAFTHKLERIFAIMWHPERASDNTYNLKDINLIKKILL